MKKMLHAGIMACLLVVLLLIAPASAHADVGTMILPPAMKIIEKEAFYGVADIDKVVIPEGTTEIHSLAFVGCSLTEVVLPSTLMYIAVDAFDINTAMDVTAPEGSYAYLRCVELGLIDAAADVPTPAECFMYEIINDTECAITKYTGDAANVVIPAELDGYAVVRIGKNAFRDCTGVKRVSLPAGVREIKACAFWHCSGLSQISLPDGLTLIEDSAFKGCTALEYIHLPDSITTIGESVFEDCEKLQSVNFPLNWTEADAYIFRGCKALTRIVVPEGVTSIPDCAFSAATYLKQVELPDTLVEIGASAFCDCTALASIRLPNSIRNIECYAFRNCESLQSVNYPMNWEKADDSIFKGCKALRSIVIPEGVTEIPAEAFCCADYLVSIEFPSTLKEIGKSAFAYCTALTAVELPAGMTVINEEVFHYCTSLTKVELPEGLTTIEGKAFYLCTGLKSIRLPDTVETLANYAFQECTSLSDVNYPVALTSGSYAFRGCTSLMTMVIPEGVTEIPSYVFSALPSLRSVYIPNTVTWISGSAFYGCSDLTIYGVAGSYAQTYASKNRIKFVAAPLPSVTLNVSTTGSTAGCIMTVTASATGGTAPYTYRYTLYRDGVQIRQTDYIAADEYRATLDQAGSYQIAVEAKDRIGSIGTARSTTHTVGAAAVTTMSGKVLMASGQPVQNVTVFIYSTAEDSSSAFITGTDENGHWSFDEAIVGHQYCIKYANDAYVIAPAQEVVIVQENHALTAAATIMQTEAGAGPISFMMTDGTNAISSVATGQPVVFRIQAANTTRARLIVDGTVYASFNVSDGAAVFERAFTQAGVRSIVFQAGNEAGWGAMSAVQTLNVTAAGGQLSAPVFVTAANEQYAFGHDVTISWNPVTNARAYKLYLYCNGVLVWQLEEATAGTSYTLDADILPAVGQYALSVIATGYGYSQAESSLPFALVGKTGTVTLVTPAKGGCYVIGDVFHITVSNPNGAYVLLEVRTPDGETILLPQTGAVKDTTVSINYEPAAVGTYAIRAYGFESPDMITTALASSYSQEATVTVEGAKLTHVSVGGGYSSILTTDAISAVAVTNNAVEYVEIYENGVLLATMRAYSEENYIRTFTAALCEPTSGLHTYVFKAFDADGGTSGTREAAFYAVKPCVQKTVYSQLHDIRLLKYPAAGSSFHSKPVYITDALTLLGTCGDYSYVQQGASKGYIATSQIADTQTYIIPALSLKMVMPKQDSVEYLGHTMALQWDCSVAISDAMKYVVVVTPAENPLYVRHIESAANKAELFTGLLGVGEHSFRVDLTSADGSVVYASSPSVKVYFYRNYEEYLDALSYDPVRYWADRLRDDLAVVRNSQKVFTTGAILEDGTVAHFELEKLTNNKMQSLYALAVGEYSAGADDIKVVQALAIANMIAEQYGTSNGLLDLSLLNDLISWLGLPEDLRWEVMFPRTYHDGKWYVSLDEEEYRLNMKKYEADKKLNKAVDWVAYGQAIINLIERYSLYTSVDSAKLKELANAFYATGDQTLNYVAQYLEMMSTPRGALTLSALIQGVDFSQDTTNKVISESGWAIARKLVKNTHLAAFLVGAKIGAKAGQAFNKTFLNVDEIYSAAFALQYYVDAAEAFYPYVSYTGGKFNGDPARYHEEFCTVAELYGRMVAGCYDASEKFYEGIDKAWVEAFWNWVRNGEGNAETVSNCAEMAEMLRSYFAYDYTQFLLASGLLDEVSRQAVAKAQRSLQLIGQPQDQYAKIGQTAVFSIEAKGDMLNCQWYIDRGAGMGWCKLKGATQTSYETSALTMDNNGYRYRCMITDAYGNEIVSDTAVLYVMAELPVTGDAFNPMAWMMMCVLSMMMLMLMRPRFLPMRNPAKGGHEDCP